MTLPFNVNATGKLQPHLVLEFSQLIGQCFALGSMTLTFNKNYWIYIVPNYQRMQGAYKKKRKTKTMVTTSYRLENR